MKIFLSLLIALITLTVTAQQNPFLMVKKIDSPTHISFKSISERLEKNIPSIAVDKANWKAFPYAPEVSFKMAHDSEKLYLKFYVTEAHILAQHSKPNTATHRDSCVEFFIDPDQSGGYYNFEFNCIGTTHLAYGPDRYERTFINPQKIKNSLFIESTLGNQPFEEKSGHFKWEMVVAIPSSIFVQHPNLTFNTLHSKANFFKCGDDTTKPHYLSWSPIDTPNPDFHQPEFFGNLVFD